MKLQYFKSQSVCSFKFHTYGQFSCPICLHWYFHFPLGVISLGLLKRSLHDTRLTAADLEVRYKETRGNTVKQRNNVRKSYERTFGCTPQRPQLRLQTVSFVAPGSAVLDSCCRCFWDEPGHDDRSDDVWLRGTMSTIRKFTVP